jgi:type I restriction enzyme, S subunit
VTPELLLEQFDVLSDAPDGVQRLRELILRLAVHGKLVPQDPDEEPASELLKRIVSSKRRLLGTGKSRSTEWDSPLMDGPYPLPGSWQWVRLSTLGTIVGGGTPKTDQPQYWTDEGGVPWLTPADLNGIKGKYIREGRRRITQIGLDDSSAQVLPANSIVFSSRAPIGYAAIAENPLATNQGFKSCVPYIEGISEYIYRFLQAAAPEIDRNAPGTTFKEVSGKIISQLPVPLPPLPEQRRIVEKVDQLMALCDKLEERQRYRDQKRVRANSALLQRLISAHHDEELTGHWERIRVSFNVLYDTPEMIAALRMAILQLAVCGKLLPQEEADEPTAVLLGKTLAEKRRLYATRGIGKPQVLPPITSAEVEATSLPAAWQWIRLGEIVERMDSGWSPACPNKPTSSLQQWGVLRTTAVQRLRYLQEEHKVLPDALQPRPEHEVKVGDLLVTRAGPKNRVGIACIVLATRPRLMISDKIIRCHVTCHYMYPPFVALCLNAGISARYIDRKKSGMAESQTNISQSNLALTPIPLAPVAEQHRVVDKVNQLLAICDELEGKLTDSRLKAANLAASVIHHLAAA